MHILFSFSLVCYPRTRRPLDCALVPWQGVVSSCLIAILLPLSWWRTRGRVPLGCWGETSHLNEWEVSNTISSKRMNTSREVRQVFFSLSDKDLEKSERYWWVKAMSTQQFRKAEAWKSLLKMLGRPMTDGKGREGSQKDSGFWEWKELDYLGVQGKQVTIGQVNHFYQQNYET